MRKKQFNGTIHFPPKRLGFLAFGMKMGAIFLAAAYTPLDRGEEDFLKM